MKVEIEMMNAVGEWVTEEFELKKTGTPFQYERDINNFAQKYGAGFEGNLALAIKYFPDVIGKERFSVKGMDKNIKFEEILEEFFQNDSSALMELTEKMGFFLSPALKMRYDKQTR